MFIHKEILKSIDTIFQRYSCFIHIIIRVVIMWFVVAGFMINMCRCLLGVKYKREGQETRIKKRIKNNDRA